MRSPPFEVGIRAVAAAFTRERGVVSITRARFYYPSIRHPTTVLKGERERLHFSSRTTTTKKPLSLSFSRECCAYYATPSLRAQTRRLARSFISPFPRVSIYTRCAFTRAVFSLSLPCVYHFLTFSCNLRAISLPGLFRARSLDARASGCCVRAALSLSLSPLFLLHCSEGGGVKSI